MIQQDGLMARQNAAAGSPFYAILSYPNDSPPHLKAWYRSAFAKDPVLLATWPTPSRPFSVMIQRRGNLFSTGVSTDGANYTLIPGTTADVDLPATTMQGLAIASGSSTGYGTASFSSITAGTPVTTRMVPPPPAPPAPPAGPSPARANPPPPAHTP